MRTVLSLAATFGIVASSSAQEPPKPVPADQTPIKLTLEGFSIRISDVSVVTGEASDDPRGGVPVKVVHLTADRLLHPSAPIWIQFSYETDFKKSDSPDKLKTIAAAIHLTPDKLWGYQPAVLEKASGKGWIRIFPHRGSEKVLILDDTFQLVVYGFTNNGQNKQAISKETIPVKLLRDGSITLSLTQYGELKTGLQKVEDLERIVKELENRK